MSNLEHIFELALSAIEKGSSYKEWRDTMCSSNCSGNAKSVWTAYRDRTPEMGDVAILHNGRKIWLMDIWELAQYTHPWMKMAEDLAKEGLKNYYRICKLSDDDNKKKWIVEGPNTFTT